MAVNSPPEIVVGTLIWRTVGGFIGGADAARVTADAVDALGGADIVGEAELHRLGAVGDRAAADRDDEVGLGRARLLGGSDHGLRAACAPASRRTCRRSAVPARRGFSRSRRSSRFSVPLTIRMRASAPSRSICSTIASAAGRPKTTSSMAPNTTRPLCTLVLPGHFGFVGRQVSGGIAATSCLKIQVVIPGRCAASNPESEASQVHLRAPGMTDLDQQPRNLVNRNAPLRQQHLRSLAFPRALLGASGSCALRRCSSTSRA